VSVVLFSCGGVFILASILEGTGVENDTISQIVCFVPVAIAISTFVWIRSESLEMKLIFKARDQRIASSPNRNFQAFTEHEYNKLIKQRK